MSAGSQAGELGQWRSARCRPQAWRDRRRRAVSGSTARRFDSPNGFVAVYGIRPSFGEALRDPHDDDTKRQAVELALEKVRYEARRAQRQFDAVDPENRLVASELEQRWNQALAQAVEVARLATLRAQPEPLNERQKERLLELGADLRQLWQHPAAAVELKKLTLRTVLEDIVVTTSDAPPQHLLHLHWKGGVHTELRVRRNGTGQHSRVADENAVELIAELSKICDDKAIAVVLNRLGYRTGQANPGACIMSITCETVGDSPTTAMMAPGCR
jgi:hypothetical protein